MKILKSSQGQALGIQQIIDFNKEGKIDYPGYRYFSLILARGCKNLEI